MLGKRKYILSMSLGVNSNIETLCMGKSKFYSSILAGGWTRLHSEDRAKKELWFF